MQWWMIINVHGYSSLAVALALLEIGRLVTCDRSGKALAVAEKYFKRVGIAHKVDVRLGLEIDTLKELLQEGAERYDFAFIDADKQMYPQYYELLLKLVYVALYRFFMQTLQLAPVQAFWMELEKLILSMRDIDTEGLALCDEPIRLTW